MDETKKSADEAEKSAVGSEFPEGKLVASSVGRRAPEVWLQNSADVSEISEGKLVSPLMAGRASAV